MAFSTFSKMRKKKRNHSRPCQRATAMVSLSKPQVSLSRGVGPPTSNRTHLLSKRKLRREVKVPRTVVKLLPGKKKLALHLQGWVTVLAERPSVETKGRSNSRSQRSTSTTLRPIRSRGMKTESKIWTNTSTMGSMRRLGGITRVRF